MFAFIGFEVLKRFWVVVSAHHLNYLLDLGLHLKEGLPPLALASNNLYRSIKQSLPISPVLLTTYTHLIATFQSSWPLIQPL